MDFFGPGRSLDRSQGDDAREHNILAVYSLAKSLRSTLGPNGMDKLISNGFGDIIVTNDGYTLLSEMRITHPAARLAVEAAVAQQESVGDGTTSVVVLAGELLKNAKQLLDDHIHPTIVVRGYRRAEKLAREILPSLSRDVKELDEGVLQAIARTAMTGKGPESSRWKLASLAVEATLRVRQPGQETFDPDAIKLERVVQNSTDESELVDGVLFAGERAHPQMLDRVVDAKVAVIAGPIEIKNPEITAQIQIQEPRQMQAFIEQEAETLNEMVRAVESAGCNVLFCQQNIEDPADYFFSRLGILAVRRVPESELVRIAKATGARIVASPLELQASDLGRAGIVREVRQGKDAMLRVENCPNPAAVTIVAKAGTQHAAEEARRALEDAIGDLASVISSRKVLPGAGAVEMQLCMRLREEAKRGLSGKERLVVEAFADALLVIPRTLIESAGIDTSEHLAYFEDAQAKGGSSIGFDLLTTSFRDCWEAGILEPFNLKQQAIASATEVAAMVLRIDEVHLGTESTK